MLVCFFHSAYEAAGATGARHSLRPLLCEGQRRCITRTQIAPRERGGAPHRHCERRVYARCTSYAGQGVRRRALAQAEAKQSRLSARAQSGLRRRCRSSRWRMAVWHSRQDERARGARPPCGLRNYGERVLAPLAVRRHRCYIL